MNIDNVLTMKTSKDLVAAMQAASLRKLSHDEVIAQRVSFVFGSIDAKNGVTKDRVRQVILSQSGATESVGS